MPRVLVVYDVSDNSRRLRLAKTLEALGLSRIQRSAFAGKVPAARLKDIVRAARAIIDSSTDVVHVIPLDERSWQSRWVLGTPLWGDVLGCRGLAVV